MIRCDALRASPDEQVVLKLPADGRVQFSWGRFTEFGTASYWVTQYLMNYGTRRISGLPLGNDLAEEVCACILGGYGIKAEIGLAAFRKLRDEGLLSSGHSADRLEASLRESISVDGRPVRYRFPKQRAERLADALGVLPELATTVSELDAKGLRKRLMEIRGIGPKTASWIARNFFESDEIAVIDIHLKRAGEIAGFFDLGWKLPKDYAQYESAFLQFANVARLPASGLDLLIWDRMRRLGEGRPSLLPPPRPHAGIVCSLMAGRGKSFDQNRQGTLSIH